MKICIVNNLFPPDGGGAERIVEQQIAQEIQKGNDVVLITTSSVDRFSDILKQVLVYQLPPCNFFHCKQLPRHNFAAKLLWHIVDTFNVLSAYRVRQILKKERPDVVHTHNLMGVGFLVPKVIKSLKLKHVHTIHDVQLVEPSGVLLWNHKRDSFEQKMYSMVMRWLMGSPDVVISPSEFLKRFYGERGFFGGSEWLLSSLKSKVISLKSGVDADVCKFLYVGSLTEHKGIEVLMMAWDLIDKMTNVELHIVGSGALESVVREWAKRDSRIIVHGQLGGDELESVYQECQVLIFPSICLENRPTVLVEAMERGLRIIVADTGGVRELVDGYDGVVLVEPRNVELLVDAINKVSGVTNASSSRIINE